jgi:hypothetical protein
MATPVTATNGAYIVSADGTVRIPLKRAVLRAVQKMFEGKESGSVILHFKNGSNAGVEDRTVYQE